MLWAFGTWLVPLLLICTLAALSGARPRTVIYIVLRC
jgi:hypothetical protein